MSRRAYQKKDQNKGLKMEPELEIRPTIVFNTFFLFQQASDCATISPTTLSSKTHHNIVADLLQLLLHFPPEPIILVTVARRLGPRIGDFKVEQGG